MASPALQILAHCGLSKGSHFSSEGPCSHPPQNFSPVNTAASIKCQCLLGHVVAEFQLRSWVFSLGLKQNLSLSLCGVAL